MSRSDEIQEQITEHMAEISLYERLNEGDQMAINERCKAITQLRAEVDLWKQELSQICEGCE